MRTDKPKIKQSVPVTGWIMLILSLGVTVLQLLAQLAPSGLQTAITESTGWTLAQAGNLITILSFITGIFVFSGSLLLDKLGIVKTAFFGILLMGVGNILTMVVGSSYALHIIARVIMGIGMGAVANIPAMVIAVWFPPAMNSLLQGIRTAVMYVGMALAFYIIIPIFNAVGQNWQITLGIFGIVLIILAFLFLIFGKEKPADDSNTDSTAIESMATEIKAESGLRQALRSKEVILITISMIIILWSFYSFNTFYPTFLATEYGLDKAAASGYTGLMPIAGIVSGIAAGAISSATGKRRLVGAPFIILMLLGFLGGCLIDPRVSPALLSASLLIGGFGASGFTIYYCTVPAELPNSNQSFFGGALALIVGSGSLVSFLIPFVFDPLSQAIGIKMAMIAMHLPLIIAVLLVLPIKETGPGRVKK